MTLSCEQNVAAGRLAYQGGHFALAQFYFEEAMRQPAFIHQSAEVRNEARRFCDTYPRAAELTESAWDALYYYQDRALARETVTRAGQLQQSMPRARELEAEIDRLDAAFDALTAARKQRDWPAAAEAATVVLAEFPSNPEALATQRMAKYAGKLDVFLRELEDWMDGVKRQAQPAPARQLLDAAAKAENEASKAGAHPQAELLNRTDCQPPLEPQTQAIEKRAQELRFNAAQQAIACVRERVLAGAFGPAREALDHYLHGVPGPEQALGAAEPHARAVLNGDRSRMAAAVRDAESKAATASGEDEAAPVIAQGMPLYAALLHYAGEAAALHTRGIAALNALAKQKDWDAAAEACAGLMAAYTACGALQQRSRVFEARRKTVMQIEAQAKALQVQGLLRRGEQAGRLLRTLATRDACEALDDKRRKELRDEAAAARNGARLVLVLGALALAVAIGIGVFLVTGGV